MESLSILDVMGHFTTNFAPKTALFNKLRQNAVDSGQLPE